MCTITWERGELCEQYLTAFEPLEPLADELDRVAAELEVHVETIKTYSHHHTGELSVEEAWQLAVASKEEFNTVMQRYRKAKRKLDKVKAECQNWI